MKFSLAVYAWAEMSGLLRIKFALWKIFYTLIFVYSSGGGGDGVDANGWKSPDAILQFSYTSISLKRDNGHLTPLETKFCVPSPNTLLLLWLCSACIETLKTTPIGGRNLITLH